MRSSVAARGAAILVALGLTEALAAPGAGVAADSCDGRPVTGSGPTAGDDVLVVRGGGAFELGRGDDLACIVGAGYHEVYGGAGDDRIIGGEGRDFVYPGAGDDRVQSGPGNDLLSDFEDRGNDVLRGGSGVDELRFSAPFERLTVDPVNVDMRAGTARGHGRDRFDGVEVLDGTGKPDVLRGGPGADRIDGVRGGDLIAGRGGDDVIFGARLLVGEQGVLDPYDGADRGLRGGSGDDAIYGGAGADRLSGGPGDDHLDGGGPGTSPGDGGDGGPGRDVCRRLEARRGCEA